MKDREWCEKVEAEIRGLKKRIDQLEGISSSADVIELDIKWPEADIEGLHFTEQRTHAIFERKEDGNYYSRDILFNSARDTDKGTERDLLTDYLECDTVKDAFIMALEKAGIRTDGKVRVFIPEKNQGVKKYNGVDWWYWLKSCYSGSATTYCRVHYTGNFIGSDTASAVGGFAPAFRVGDNRHG